MARKFILVPHDLYKSLLSLNDAGHVSEAQNQLDSTLTDPTKDASTKNAVYNKQLHNFLKLQRELANKPLKVEVTNEPAPAPTAVPQMPEEEPLEEEEHTPRPRRGRPPGRQPRRESNQRSAAEDELLRVINQDHAKYGVNSKGQVLNFRKRAIPNSKVTDVVRHLLHPRPFAPDPPGTVELRAALSVYRDTRAMIENRQSGEGKRPFKPSLWTF